MIAVCIIFIAANICGVPEDIQTFQPWKPRIPVAPGRLFYPVPSDIDETRTRDTVTFRNTAANEDKTQPSTAPIPFLASTRTAAVHNVIDSLDSDRDLSAKPSEHYPHQTKNPPIRHRSSCQNVNICNITYPPSFPAQPRPPFQSVPSRISHPDIGPAVHSLPRDKGTGSYALGAPPARPSTYPVQLPGATVQV